MGRVDDKKQIPATESASTCASAMMVMVSTSGSDHDTRWKYAARRSSSSPHSPAAVMQKPQLLKSHIKLLILFYYIVSS